MKAVGKNCIKILKNYKKKKGLDSESKVGSSGSAIVPLKQDLEFESCEWRKLALGELYPFVGRPGSNRI